MEAMKKRQQELLQQHIVIANIVHMQYLAVAEEAGVELDHRLFPRKKKVKYDHERALWCINLDYLGRVPRFDYRQFSRMFRLSRRRFKRLMNDIGRRGIDFCAKNVDATKATGASFEARLLLPLKCMACGVPPNVFRDYFQMSDTLARLCCHTFYKTIVDLYTGEYLRMPTESDLKKVTALHEAVHGVKGMMGSLDCMHTWWKNCPVAWKGSYKGKEKRSTMVLEGMCDHHLWFWHAAHAVPEP